MGSQHSGSVKEISIINDDTLEFLFTDRISVFDKVIPSTIEGKGETLCTEGAFWFERIESIGIRTHFKKRPSPNTMHVRKVDVIRDYDAIDETTTNYLIPLEFICRHYVAGSLHARLQSGALSPADVGFEDDHTITYGEKLPFPYIETSTKLEPVDRLLDEKEALAISGLTLEEYEDICETIIKIDLEIARQVESRDLIHVDGKKEFAFDEKRRPMVIDVFGTADEDRFWDLPAWKDGTCVELSKEFVRKYYESIGYKERLYAARARGEPEPEMPPLPDEMRAKASKIYKEMQYRITGMR
ncbi:phosphoribosylaminoimidazolesuccinocarboxamide synthase [archaeon]|nr:MAG: phosphoribosylaminoimidazolesuccinocarboxamide synthase [archaeon]